MNKAVGLTIMFIGPGSLSIESKLQGPCLALEVSGVDTKISFKGGWLRFLAVAVVGLLVSTA